MAFRADGERFVVRFAATDDDFRSDEHAVRFRSPDLPIPTVHAIGEVAGGWVAISDLLEGDYLEACDEPTMRSRLLSLFAGKHIGEHVDQDAYFESVAAHQDGFWLKVANFRADHAVGFRRMEALRRVQTEGWGVQGRML